MAINIHIERIIHRFAFIFAAVLISSFFIFPAFAGKPAARVAAPTFIPSTLVAINFEGSKSVDLLNTLDGISITDEFSRSTGVSFYGGSFSWPDGQITFNGPPGVFPNRIDGGQLYDPWVISFRGRKVISFEIELRDRDTTMRQDPNDPSIWYPLDQVHAVYAYDANGVIIGYSSYFEQLSPDPKVIRLLYSAPQGSTIDSILVLTRAYGAVSVKSLRYEYVK